MERFTVTLRNDKTLTSTEFTLVGAIDQAKKIKRDKIFVIPTEQGLFHIQGKEATCIQVEYGGPLKGEEAMACMEYDPLTPYFTDEGHLYRYNDHADTYERQRQDGTEWDSTVFPANSRLTRQDKVLFIRS